MKKVLLAFTLMLCSLCLFAGGSSESTAAASDTLDTTIDSPITIEFWHSFSGTQLPIIDGLVAEFNSTVGQEKGITVVPVAQGSGSQLYSKTIGAIRAGNAPAVAMSKPPFVQDFIMADYVVDLLPYIEDAEVGIADKDDFIDAFWQEGLSYSIEGMYSLPLAKNSDVLYYNADFFAEHGFTAPTTWDELEVLSAQIHEITGMGAVGYDNLQYLFENLTVQNGGQYTDKEGNLLFAEGDAALRGLQVYAENVWAGIYRTAGEDYFFSGPFANGTIQMYIGGTVESQYINMKEPKFSWSAAPLPQVDPSNPKTLNYDQVICALNPNASGDQKYASYEFIKFITSTQATKTISMNTAYMAVRESVLDDPEYSAFLANGGNDALKAAYSQIDSLYSQPVFIADTYTSSTVDSEITSMMKRILDDHQDPATEIQNVVRALR